MPAGRVRLTLAALMALVATAPPAAGEDAPAVRPALTIGVVPQRGFDDDEGKLMEDAGISSVRDWFSWAQVEARRGERNWGPLDDTVTANARAGMTTLPFLFGT